MPIQLRKFYFILIFFSGNHVFSQNLTTRDSITSFLDSAFHLIKRNALYGDKLDWAIDIPFYYKTALSKKRFRDMLPVFSLVFEKMEDNHSVVWIDSTAFKAKTDFIEKTKHNKLLAAACSSGKAILRTERLGNFGYIRIPYIHITTPTLEEEIKMSQKIHDMICNIYSDDIQGWILDLRLNGGGDMYPMITALQQFIGDITFASVIDKDNKKVAWRIKDHGTWEGDNEIAKLQSPCLPDLTGKKVAVLISQYTASSGEITALAFRGRKNTKFFGERTRGLMTANYVYSMPFGEGILPMGILLVLAQGHETDRTGKIHRFIYPDLEVFEGDNFDDLQQDKKILRAMEWLSE